MNLNVLIVDDTPINLILFSALIEKLDGCTDFPFAEPLKALEWAKTNTTDLVILDYMMPEMDGLEFITAFRKLPGHEETPILMVTASGQKEVRYAALDLGATDFLMKPLDRVEFLTRTKNMLTMQASRKKLGDHAAWLADEVRKATSEIVLRERETVLRLSKAAEYRDPETGAHIMRMAHYAQLIGKQLGLSVDEQELLLEAAPLHDIGKVGIPDGILLKPGKLTEAEFEIMRQHAQIGYEVLKGSSSRVLQSGAEIAHCHHEKFDGSGYPRGLVGEAIPLFSRIVAVADVFDALTSERPYKKMWDDESATQLIRSQSGLHFDPRCVEAFFSGWDEVMQIRAIFRDTA